MVAQQSDSPSGGAADDALNGVSAFVARVLDQLSLSAWLPSAFLTVAGSFLLQFRAQSSLNFAGAATSLTKHPATILILALPVLISSTLVTQAFSFEAIQILEGYWRRPSVMGLLRNPLIRWHVHRKTSLGIRRKNACAKAFSNARPRLLESKVPHAIVNALEADALGTDLPPLTSEEENRFNKMSWRFRCNAWELARVDHLLAAEQGYPQTSRILPTRLGNLIRATEDQLKHVVDQDLEGFVLRQRNTIPNRIQQQHDQFRNRLEMYCILVFVSGILAVAAPILLTGRSIHVWEILVILVGFMTVSFASYQAAIASAKGYCVALKQIDNAVEVSALLYWIHKGAIDWTLRLFFIANFLAAYGTFIFPYFRDGCPRYAIVGHASNVLPCKAARQAPIPVRQS